MSVRTKGDKIGMWLGDANVGESIINVGKRTKERLNIENQVRIGNSLGILREFGNSLWFLGNFDISGGIWEFFHFGNSWGNLWGISEFCGKKDQGTLEYRQPAKEKRILWDFL